MSDTTDSTADTPAATTPAADPATPETTGRPRGYFNQAQLEDLATAELLLAAAQAHPDELATRDITAEYLTGFAAAITQARAKTTDTGQAADQGGAATLSALGAERALVVALQGIQAAAKQKHRMLAEDDDPATNFPTDGYLIGQRLNPNRATLLQNAATLLARARADALPGYPAAQIDIVADALATYQQAEVGQQTADEAGGADRNQRDGLIRKINARRMAIQHAADALWPYTAEGARPIRKSFQLPLTRPFNG